jgi:flavin reductase (DIM6/NTAB) family NADH-FMN oxidoreductase RutF
MKIEQAMEAKYPQRVALVVCKDKDKVDVTPISWFSNASGHDSPWTWLISLGKGYHSTKIISRTKEFTLCFPTVRQIKDVLYCGSVSRRKVDKLEHCNFKPVPAKKVKAPLIKGCTACYECVVIGKVPVFGQIVFIGKVVAASKQGAGKALYHFGKYRLGALR